VNNVVTVDCYRTLIDFDLESAPHDILAGRCGVDEEPRRPDLAQVTRLRRVLEADHEWGAAEVTWLDRTEPERRVPIDGMLAATWTPRPANRDHR
jgi:hypothetical protein